MFSLSLLLNSIHAGCFGFGCVAVSYEKGVTHQQENHFDNERQPRAAKVIRRNTLFWVKGCCLSSGWVMKKKKLITYHLNVWFEDGTIAAWFPLMTDLPRKLVLMNPVFRTRKILNHHSQLETFTILEKKNHETFFVLFCFFFLYRECSFFLSLSLSFSLYAMPIKRISSLLYNSIYNILKSE